MLSIGEILEELRKDKGYTQKELADVLNVSKSSISNYENGVNLPDLETLILIADIYDVSVDFLLGRTTIRLNVRNFSKENIGNISVSDFISYVLTLDKEHRILLLRLLKLLLLENEWEHKRKSLI